MDFGDRIRRLLSDRNISQKDFAAEIGVAASTAGNYVNGMREPDYETLRRIAQYFQVSTDYLLGRKYDISTDDEQNELLLIFNSLNHNQRQLFLEQGKLLLKSK
ncbi:hypothetical protein I4100191B2_11560 [Clostridiales bacterium]